MSTKITTTLMLALVLLSGGFILTHAATTMDATSGNTVVGTVLFVDADTGLLWLQSREGNIVKMAAPTTLLRDLSKGEAIKLSITEQIDTSTTEAHPGTMLTAQVQKIDAANELLRLKTDKGEIIDVTSAKTFLDGLQQGDSVAVAIRKQRS